MKGKLERIALGGGCFWCTEAALNEVKGVIKATPGYSGGTAVDPSYEEVCTGNTGHAEVVLIEFDPEQVSLEGLLDVFFAMHDPTSLNRQGNDAGTQYRSIVLYGSEDQKTKIDRFIGETSKNYDKPVVTEVRPLESFYPAEEYHLRYYEKNPRQPYCQFVISPKVDKIRKKLGRA
ncbi:MAG: peptide-methionine (S)-S-oxide reductase MsrA [Actinobacteria bacterium]|nr:peptide-methionine (S)-S-oxide reductase MsrA [Actinomycetota bacterium]